jgi:hypothetical protein
MPVRTVGWLCAAMALAGAVLGFAAGLVLQ